MILLGSAARAEVQTVEPHPSRLQPLVPAALALVSAPRQGIEISGLRTGLAKAQASDRIARLDRKAWNGAGAKAVRGTGATSSGGSTRSYSADWYGIAACESGGAWSVNSGNGYWGGLQFSPSTWFAYGGGPFDGSGAFPYSASQQIAVAERILADQGPSAWPNCFRWA